jgi:hypothetical protein
MNKKIIYLILHSSTEAKSNLMMIAWASCIFSTKSRISWDPRYFTRPGSAFGERAWIIVSMLGGL